MPAAVSNYNDFAIGTTFGQITVGNGSPSALSSYTFGGNGIVLTNGMAIGGAPPGDTNISVTFDCNVAVGSAAETFSNSLPLIINGTLNLNSSTLMLNNSSAVTLGGMVTASSFFSAFLFQTNSGTLTVSSNAQFIDPQRLITVEVAQGSLVLNGAATNSFFFVTNGSMALNGPVYLAEIQSSNAVISGTGFAHDLESIGTNGGVFIPGNNGIPGILGCGTFGMRNFGAPSTLDIPINSLVPGTGYSQLVVSNSYNLNNGALNLEMNYIAQIGDSFLVLKGLPGFTSLNPFVGLPNFSIYDATNGNSLFITYDTNGITMTTIRSPASPFLLWKGSSGSWSSKTNWAQGASPTNGSQLLFGPYGLGAPNARLVIDDIAESVVLASVTFTGSNYSLNNTIGQFPLVVSQGITNNAVTGTTTFNVDLETVDDVPIDVEPGGTLVFAGSILGSDTVSKEGPGKLIYTGTTMDSFVGAVVVDSGTMEVDGSFIDGSFTVNGGLLDGSGAVSSLVMNGGALKPGTITPDILRVKGDLTMSPGTVYQSVLNGAIPKSQYNQLQVDGMESLNSATLSLQVGFTPAPGTSFIIIANQGTSPVVGTFAGLPEGAIFQAGGQSFSITYKAGPRGNNIVLTAVNPPGNLVCIMPLSASTVQLEGLGGSNLTYTIQANTNLATTNWLTIGSAQANGSGTFLFNDTNAALFPQRYFRVLGP
jgi:hypothetical protein